jgi:hypothetical protein
MTTLGPDILLTDDGDFDMSTGTLVMGVSLRDAIRMRLLWFKGEWFLNTDFGLDYFQRILVKKPVISLVTAMFRKCIAETPGVIKVNRIAVEYKQKERTFKVSYEAEGSESSVSAEELI